MQLRCKHPVLDPKRAGNTYAASFRHQGRGGRGEVSTCQLQVHTLMRKGSNTMQKR